MQEVWPICCRWDIDLVSSPPIGTVFGPQNTLQSLQVKCGATCMLFCSDLQNLFPDVLQTATYIHYWILLIPTIPTVVYTSGLVPYWGRNITPEFAISLFTYFTWAVLPQTLENYGTYYASLDRYYQGGFNVEGYVEGKGVSTEIYGKYRNYATGSHWGYWCLPY